MWFIVSLIYIPFNIGHYFLFHSAKDGLVDAAYMASTIGYSIHLLCMLLLTSMYCMTVILY